MHIDRRYYALSIVLLVVCSACGYSPDLVGKTVSYNETVATSNDQILLLNVIRASQRFPTYYTRLESNTSIGTFSPQLQLSLPLSAASQTPTNVMGVAKHFTRGTLLATPQL